MPAGALTVTRTSLAKMHKLWYAKTIKMIRMKWQDCTVDTSAVEGCICLEATCFTKAALDWRSLG
jgi:hypothetical protein